MNLGRRRDGGAGPGRIRSLFERNGGGETLDSIHVGLFDPIEKLARGDRKALDIAAPAFGVERVEGEGGFARAADPSDDHEFAPWNLEVEVLQVMLARADHAEILIGQGGHLLSGSARILLPTWVIDEY